MAQFNKSTQDFLNQERTLFEVNMVANKNGEVVSYDNPFPVSLGSSSITIIGNITIPGIVTVSNPPTDPLHEHIIEVGNSGIFTTKYLPIGIGTQDLNLSYLPVGISSLLNTVSISNTSFFVSGVGSIINVSVANTVSISNTAFSVNNNGSVVSETNRFPVSLGSSTIAVSIGGTTIVNTAIASLPDAATSAFDEPLSITLTPVIQADAVFGYDPDTFHSTQIGGATVGIASTVKMWSVESGIGSTSFGRIRTKRFVRYQPGQGCLFRFTAQFTSTGIGTAAVGVNYAAQGAGAVNREDSYYFGFNGNPSTPKFGIAHSYGGVAEIRTLSITTAPTGSQTAIITLNNVVYNVPINSGTANYAAAEISDYLKTTITDGTWEIEQCNNTVVFVAHRAGAITGTFSFSSSGAGTLAVGSFDRTTPGGSATTDWTYIDAWDKPILNLDPSKLNVYQIDYRWLGAGIVRFFLEDPTTGKMTLVHTQKWANRNNRPHINKPSLRLAYVSIAAGGTPAQNAIVRGASIYGAIEGLINQTGYSQGYFNLDSSTRAKDLVWHLMSIQNPHIRVGGVNTSQLIIQDLSVAAQGNDPFVIYIVVNPVGTSDHLVFQSIPGATGPTNFAQYSVSNVNENLSLDRIAVVQTLAINGASQYDLIPYNFSIPAGDCISIFISSTNAINRTSVALTWRID